MLAVHFDGLLGGAMGEKMADLNYRYLAMEAAGLKRFSEEGPRDPNIPLETWNADAVRALNRNPRSTGASASLREYTPPGVDDGGYEGDELAYW